MNERTGGVQWKKGYKSTLKGEEFKNEFCRDAKEVVKSQPKSGMATDRVSWRENTHNNNSDKEALIREECGWDRETRCSVSGRRGTSD